MRVLVDTNIWIDHLRKTEPVLVDLLERDQVCVHQSVITELALGNLKDRSVFLKALERLMVLRNVDDQGVRHLVEERRLWGRGLSAVDAALLASVVVTPGVSLWTRDKRLRQAAHDMGVLAELDCGAHSDEAGARGSVARRCCWDRVCCEGAAEGREALWLLGGKHWCVPTPL